MPTPVKSYKIAGKVTGGTVTSGAYVIVRNLNSGDQTIVKTNTAGEFVVNLADNLFPNGYSNSDIIEYSLVGDGFGGGTHTVNTSAGGTKSANIAQTERSATNTVGVTI